MMIIKIEANKDGQHLFQSQSHRQECWLDGYVVVPAFLESDVLACNGYCDLTIKNSRLTEVQGKPELMPTEPEAEPNPTELDILREEIEKLKAELAEVKGAVE